MLADSHPNSHAKVSVRYRVFNGGNDDILGTVVAVEVECASLSLSALPPPLTRILLGGLGTRRATKHGARLTGLERSRT